MDEAVAGVFDTLEWLEERLGDGRRFLMGDALTLADIRLFTTLVRFDPVYVGHFKCNVRRLVDFPALWALHAAGVPDRRGRGDGRSGIISSGIITAAIRRSIRPGSCLPGRGSTSSRR